MKNGIPTEKYYKLLEWKDENLEVWAHKSTHVYGVERLCDMSPKMLKHLYKEVFNEEV